MVTRRSRATVREAMVARKRLQSLVKQESQKKVRTALLQRTCKTKKRLKRTPKKKTLLLRKRLNRR